MNITGATKYQDAFDAVTAGSASPAQCIEVIAVAHALGAELREAALRAKALPARRDGFAALLSADGKAALDAALPIDTDAKPRIALDEKTGIAGAPKDFEQATVAEAAAVR